MSRPRSYRGQPRSQDGRFARKRGRTLAGMGITIKGTRKINGAAIRRVRTT